MTIKPIRHYYMPMKVVAWNMVKLNAGPDEEPIDFDKFSVHKSIGFVPLFESLEDLHAAYPGAEYEIITGEVIPC